MIPVNVPNLLKTVTTIAYGGRQAGVDNPDVAWIGTTSAGGQFFIRTTAAGAFTATNYAAFANTDTPQNVVLDPENWQHAFVVDANSVFVTEDGGNIWTDITGNLLSLIPAVQGLAAPGNLLNTIAFGTDGGAQVVLVGGVGGVFRNVLGSGNQWSEYGAGIPNASVRDIEYDRRSDTLEAGILGRGAWSVSSARNTLAATGALQIFGDENFVGQDDTILLIRDASNPSLLDVFLDGDMEQFQLSVIQQISVFGLLGSDTLIVDSMNGLISLASPGFGFPGRISFDGGEGTDSLGLHQTGGDLQSSDSYSFRGMTDPTGLSVRVGLTIQDD